MNLIGQIKKIDQNYAYVHIHPDSSCGATCGSCGGCSFQEGRHVKIKNDNYRQGQLLDIHVNSNQALIALIVSAGIILALLIGGYFLGSTLFKSPSETPGVIGGLIGIVVGAIVVKALEPFWQRVEYKVVPID
ncbi:MAG: SoxR reducing system RseC family protein [Firmicutes bacterium]|nr:SoxR reducing system RseC family protein [Bacillota bacterium]MDD4264358.1 SoxR reducing system RseC family protein [Bacillota bacterium]MDD4693638.1 SoxR reducing system RseC family protein [Bacillota bacterium]